MYGTRDAPQIQAETVRAEMQTVGFQALHPSLYQNVKQCITIVVRVVDFSRMGSTDGYMILEAEV